MMIVLKISGNVTVALPKVSSDFDTALKYAKQEADDNTLANFEIYELHGRRLAYSQVKRQGGLLAIEWFTT